MVMVMVCYLELREVGGGERELMKLELWALLGL